MTTSRRALTLSAALACALASIGIFLGQAQAWRALEEWAQGTVVSLRAPRAANPQVLVIDVDDQSLRELGWPVRRDLYAQVVAAAAGSGAKVLAFDLVLTDPAKDPTQDLALAQVSADWGEVVLPAECVATVTAAAPECSAFIFPAGKLSEGVTLAHQSTSDRGAPWWLESRGLRLPSLALAAFARGNAVAPGEIKQTPRSISVGPHVIAADPEGSAIASARLSPIENRRSLRWLLAELKAAPPDVVPESVGALFKDKYLVLGQTALTLGGPPRVMLHAALLSDLIEGTSTRELSRGVGALLVLLMVALLTATALALRPVLATAVAVVLVGVFLFACVWAAGQGWLVSPVAVLLAGSTAFAGASATRRSAQQNARAQLRNAFVATVGGPVLERVLDAPDRYLKLGGAKKTVTVLFSDIKGYYGLPADQVIHLVREYLEAMTHLVKKQEGRVDTIMGEGILAVFGDPIPHEDHALRAVTVGMQMLEEIARLQQLWAGQGKKGLAIRLGVATGEVFVGDLGPANTRIEYSVLGPAVNLALRLEGKAPSGAMLVSEETYEACRDHYSFHEIGGLELRGYTDTYQAWLFVGAGLEGDPERSAPRLPTQAPVVVRMGELTLQGIVENVSAGGLYVTVEGKAKLGDVIELEFSASSHLASPVTVRAEVRHVERRADGQQGIGVRIQRADASRGDDLRHFVALYLGPQPDGGRVDAGGDTFRLELGEAYGRMIKEEPS